jgi:transposase
MLKVDQVHVIRHKVWVEGRSQRQIAKEFGISRVTVRKYVEEAVPIRKETEPRARPVWDAVGPRVKDLLAESAQWTGGKQQLTATRLHELLVAEGHRVGVTVVKEAVAEWKRQRREVFVPLTYRPGDLAEVDFFEVLVDVDGTRRKAWLFLMRLMYSGRDFAWIYDRQDQISFLDGHVRAFTHVEGVPGRIAYDNLRAAVVRILVGGERALTARFAALASHYLVEPCFCRPGEGHDKGGVEARGKAVRRQALVPIPSAPTLAAINEALLARMDARLETRRDVAGQTIGTRFAEETLHFRAVPLPFVAEATTVGTVSPRALVRLEGAVYSGRAGGRARSDRPPWRDDRHDCRPRWHTPSPRLVLSTEQRIELESRVRSRRGRADAARRARVLLLLADGDSYASITAKTGCRSRTIALWKRRFEADGLAGLTARHRGSKPTVLTPRLQARILACTRRAPPHGATQLVDAVVGLPRRGAAHHHCPRVARRRSATASPRALHALDGPGL